MGEQNDHTRRGFLRVSATLGVGMITAGCVSQGGGQSAAKKNSDRQPREGEKRKEGDQGGEEDVSPAEDLMREHGVLKRVLLVYGEGIRRLDANQDLPPEPIADAAKIIRTFIEDY